MDDLERLRQELERALEEKELDQAFEERMERDD